MDFSNSRFDNARLRLMGPGAPTLIRPSPDGLVISMPRGSNADELGFAPRFSLRSDFEITLQYELIQITQPKEGYGVGASIYVITVAEEEDAATVGRLHRVREGQVHSTHLARTPGGEGRRHHDVRFYENDTRRGLLRLTRVGDQLRFAASAGGEADFRTLRELRFSTGRRPRARQSKSRVAANASAVAPAWKNFHCPRTVRFHRAQRASPFGIRRCASCVGA